MAFGLHAPPAPLTEDPPISPATPYIDTQADLDALVARMRGAPRIAVDTEADSMHSYFEKVCLIQLTFAAETVLVDPLAGLDPGGLLDVFRGHDLLLHGMDYDLRMLRQCYDFRPERPVYDTMLAGQLLGYRSFGLQAMVERFCGVVLPKGSAKSDWSQRPLSDTQLRYAADDTRYLPEVADGCAAELERLGRTAWHREWCAWVVANTEAEREVEPDREWRFKGLQDCDRRELAFARALWYWRDAEARRADVPAFKILGNGPLLHLARRAAADPEWSPANEHLPRNLKGRRLDALFGAVREARSLPKADWPYQPRGGGERPPPWHRQRVDALRDASRVVADGLGLDVGVVAPRATLSAIAREDTTDIDQLVADTRAMRWQMELLLPAIRDVFRRIPVA